MTMMQDAAANWVTIKPLAITLAIGLVAGPLISNYVGWQVTSGTSQRLAHDGVIEQQALICEERARGDVKEPGKLEWSARADLAKKWTAMPGVDPANSEVTGACAAKLAA
jgi:hypothetical protein